MKIDLKKGRKVIEMFMGEEDEDGIQAISIVSSPAIEKDFLMLSKDQTVAPEPYAVKLLSEEKRTICGPVLIPDLEIYRNDPQEGEYYIKFSKDTVRKASEQYMKLGYQGNVTEEHKNDVQDVYMTEAWIVEGAVDKSTHLGFKLPVGTFMATHKVINDDLWNKIKAGELKGYSLEGMFAPTKLAKQEPTLEDVITATASIYYK